MSFQDLLKKQEVEDSGTWVPFPKDLGGEALIAHHQNADALRATRRLVARYRKQHRVAVEDIPPEAWEEIVRTAWVGTVLKQIRGVEFEPGVPMESTPENLRAILDSRDGFNFVSAVAKAEASYEDEVAQAVAKNSGASSAGD